MRLNRFGDSKEFASIISFLATVKLKIRNITNCSTSVLKDVAKFSKGIHKQRKELVADQSNHVAELSLH